MNIKVKHILYVGAFILFTILGFLMFPNNEETIIVPANDYSGEEDSYIFVHITGEVNSPGIKKVKLGTRLFELIKLASGETLNADLSKINLASVLKDEQKIVIPAVYIADSFDESTSSGVTSSTGQSKSKLVSINYSSMAELQTLPGIGPSMAKKIVEYRENNGGFNSIEDIKNVSGIGESKFNKIKDDITI